MNITLALLKRVGLSKKDVGEITSSLKEKVKSLQGEVDKTRSDMSFWKSEMKKRSPKKKCTNCGEEIDVWPFNDTEAYYIKGDKVQHVKCKGDN